jgi:riboflavin kinase/FMN adenylyltransferase
MQIIRHLAHVPDSARRAVVALGNFDGVHRGHQAVIGQAAALADEMGVPLGVIVFEPYPREHFNPGAPSFRLTSFHSKARIFERLGVEILYVLNFDAAMASKTAPDFVYEILVKGLGILHLVVGYDFAFGRGRSGDASVLRWMGLMEGFGLTVVEPVYLPAEGDKRSELFSSTRIREHIAAGHMREAADQLGHWWSVEGHVKRGEQRGRTLGFPTANIDISHYLRPALGIYAVWVEIMPPAGQADGPPRAAEIHPGVAYFGGRPTFGQEEVFLEAFLFDFSGDLYGRQLRVSFIEQLRGDQTFESAEALKQQMEKDAAEAHRILTEERAQLGAYELGLDAIAGPGHSTS